MTLCVEPVFAVWRNIVTSQKKYTVPAVAKALDILEYVGAHDNSTLQEVAAGLGFPKTSVYQLLRTLTERGYLRQGRGGEYSLGMQLFSLGNKALSQLDIRNEATPIMYELMRKTQLTVFLATLESGEGIYLAKVDGPYSVATRTWVGKRFNLATTSLGKALLAWRPLQEIGEICSTFTWEPVTANSITSLEDFLEHLAAVRARGWAEDNEENMPAIRCAALPVFGANGDVVAAISVSGHVQHFPEEKLAVNAGAVSDATRQLSRRIGFPQPAK